MIIFEDGTKFSTPDFSGPISTYKYRREKMKQTPMVAVYDKKIGLFDQPFTCRHVGDAIRDFDTVKKNQDTKFGKNPEDFEIYQIATYNEENGEITSIKPHLQLS